MPNPSAASPAEASTSPSDGAAAGVVAGGVALVTTELLAAVVPSTPSFVASVGQDVIDRIPPVVEDVAIRLFGTYDKVALVVGIVVVSLVLAAVFGAVAVRRFSLAVLGFVVFGVVGTTAAVAAAASVQGPVLSGAAAVAAGVAVLRRLVVPLPLRRRPPPSSSPEGGTDAARRAFVRLAATGAGVAAAVAGRGLARWLSAGAPPSDIVLAPPATSLPAPASAAALDVEGLSPLFTPNADFYRIDTALVVPRVDVRLAPAGHRHGRPSLRAHLRRPARARPGRSRHHLVVRLQRGRRRPRGQRPVAGGTARRPVGPSRGPGGRHPDRGPLRRRLDRRVPHRSGGGRTGALIAVGMNGEPLPLDHGFLARLVVAGLYGYVSATKWLSEIELTTLDAVDGYWVPRGWSKLGPVDTQARIDVPRFGARLQAGRQAIAGVAWAPSRGISLVEVSVDEGPWSDAVLADPLGIDAWRQWRYEWDARPGRHDIRVRATDGEGHPDRRTECASTRRSHRLSHHHRHRRRPGLTGCLGAGPGSSDDGGGSGAGANGGSG